RLVSIALAMGSGTWYPWTLYRQVWVENSWPVALDVASDNVTFAAGVWDRSIRLFDLASLE
ncbi:hypothetical protein, partial [Proteus mirabilis]|uniref:hypothetical protein n=1 Tax=Proteus mirabilis TaxID=584 RepID=UPI001952EA8C